MKLLLIPFLALPLVIATPLFAGERAADAGAAQESEISLRARLLSVWEQTITNDPGTTRFEKTDKVGIYNIDTTVLPYKGRVRVLNIVVGTYTPSAEYDKQVKYGGVVETELMDAPKDMAQNQPFSFDKWKKMGWFDYDGKTHQWFSFRDWNRHFPPDKRGAATPDPGA